MSALVLLPPFLTLIGIGIGFAAAKLLARANRRQTQEPPPRGFRPVVIEGGKAPVVPIAAQDAAP